MSPTATQPWTRPSPIAATVTTRPAPAVREPSKAKTEPPASKTLLTAQLGARVTQKDVLAVTRQLSVMMKAGIGITEALDSIGQQTTNPKLRKLMSDLYADVESGKPFSEALAAHPKVFSTLYINMIRASELSGGFSQVLRRLAEYLTHQIETRSSVRAAMVYPIIIGCMAVVTTVFMLTFVLPKFVILFQGKEDLLPMPTKILLALSGSLTSFWYLYVLGAGTLVGGLIMFLRTPTGQYTFDTLKLRVPVFRKLFHCLYLSRGLRTMGELVNAGVPMLETITVTGKVCGNVHYEELWQQVRQAVGEGKTISVTLLKSTLMPRGVTQMISSGEQSGNLGEVLNDISEYYDRELKAVIKSSTAMLEPMMIVVMGGIVGFVASSIMLPIFSMSKLVK